MSVKRGWCPFWPGFWTDRSKNSENEDVIPRINLILTFFFNYRQQELSRRKPENRKVQPTTFVSDEPEFISTVMLRECWTQIKNRSWILTSLILSLSSLRFSFLIIERQSNAFCHATKWILINLHANLPANFSFLDRLSNIWFPYDFELPKW